MCWHSSGNASSWGHSAMKLTSRVFSAIKNIGGTFVTVEDGIVSTASQKGTFVDFDGAELAEDAMLRYDNERSSQETVAGVDSIPVIRLDAGDVTPVRVASYTNNHTSDKDSVQDSVIQQSSLSSHHSQFSADIALESLSASPGLEHQTAEEPNDDNNIIFSSGVRRKVQRRKQSKGNVKS